MNLSHSYAELKTQHFSGSLSIKQELKLELKSTKASNREITVYCRTIDEEKILDISKKYTNEIITVSLVDEASMTTTFYYYENGEKIQTSIIEEE